MRQKNPVVLLACVVFCFYFPHAAHASNGGWHQVVGGETTTEKEKDRRRIQTAAVPAAKAKQAIVFISPSLGAWDRYISSPRILYEYNWYKKNGYKVDMRTGSEDDIMNALARENSHAMSYFGHGGPLHATIGALDAKGWRNKAFTTYHRYYISMKYSPEEAFKLAGEKSRNFGLAIFRNHSCDSLTDTFLAHQFVKEGGLYCGVRSGYVPFPISTGILFNTADFLLDDYRVQTLDWAISQVREITHEDLHTQNRLRAEKAMSLVSSRLEKINDLWGWLQDKFGTAKKFWGGNPTDFIKRITKIRDTKEIYGKEKAELLWNLRIGACAEYTELLVWILKAVGTDDVATFYNHSRPGGHRFPVVNLSADHDPDIPWTWGPQAVVPDPWLNQLLTQTPEIWKHPYFFEWGKWYIHSGGEKLTTRERLEFFVERGHEFISKHCPEYREVYGKFQTIPPEFQTKGYVHTDMGRLPTKYSPPDPGPICKGITAGAGAHALLRAEITFYSITGKKPGDRLDLITKTWWVPAFVGPMRSLTQAIKCTDKLIEEKFGPRGRDLTGWLNAYSRTGDLYTVDWSVAKDKDLPARFDPKLVPRETNVSRQGGGPQWPK